MGKLNHFCIPLKYTLILLMSSFFGFISIDAQTLHGKIVDAKTQEPIVGAVVSIKGTKGNVSGAATDLNGDFTLHLSNTPVTIVASYTGYNNEEVEIYEITDDKIQISLKENFNSLNEVVVIAYGTQKKSDLTGSLTQLKSEDFNKGITTSVDQLLQGTAPGLNIQQSSSEPGGGVNVRIRGNSSINASSSPLYVIDGLPIDNSTISATSNAGIAGGIGKNPLNSLNPADVESVEVLKDASATAIYGSRAANGVILIQTKQGQTGKAKVDYSFSVGFQTPAKKIDVLSAQDYIQVMNELAIARGESVPFSSEDAEQIGNGTNWQNQIFRTAEVQTHNISVSGGSNHIHYFLSGNYLHQDGIVRNTGIEKFGTRINLANDISKKIKIGVNLLTSRINDSNFSDGNGLNEEGGPVNSALLYDPTESVYDEEGNLTSSTNLTINNPERLIEGVSNKTVTTRSLGNFFLEYNPIKELKIKWNIGTDLQNIRKDIYNSTKTINGSGENGIASISTFESSDYDSELTINYNKNIISKLNLDALIGTTYQHFLTRTFGASVGDFPSDELFTNNLSLGNISTASLGSDKESNSLLSYFARTNLNFEDRYLLTASIRADGSSKFGKNNRFGYFPSFAFSWNISNEKFISKVFENLKLRVSYGLTGNQDIGNYQSIRTYTTGGTFVSGNSYTGGIAPSRIANPDLKWETTGQFNVGLDVSILKSRLSGSFDYYIKDTWDMLINQPLPSATGYSSIYKNLGSMRNSGLEFAINGVILNEQNLKWNIALNLATVKNKVTDLGSVTRILTGSIANGGNTTIIQRGSPAFSYFGYHVIGIFKDEKEVENSSQPNSKPGYPIFEDVNKDGQITADDETIIGDPYPDFTYGIHNDITYKRFNLSFLIQGQVGGDILNGNIIESLYPSNYRRNLLSVVALNRWTTDNTNAVWPSSVNPSSYDGGKVNSLAIQSATYLRLKFIQFSYHLPIPKNKLIEDASIYINAQNLFTISSYLGYDPESSIFGSGSAHVDLNAYPLSRTFSFGINLSF